MNFFQLLDLMHTLHTRAATIFSSWAEEERHRLAEPREPYLEGLPGIDAGTSTLWTKCWCPLLQGMKFPGTRYSLNFEQRIVLSRSYKRFPKHSWSLNLAKGVIIILFSMFSSHHSLMNPGIARLCCDSRRQVRSQALTYLQRALLVHDLQTLSAVEWESCFNKVWFAVMIKE